MSLMDFLKKIAWTPLNILKAAGVLLVALFILSIAYSLFLKPVASTMMREGGRLVSVTQGIAPSYGGGYAEDYSYAEEAAYDGAGAAPKLSLENIGVPMPPRPGGTVGGDAEDYEVREYSVSIETRGRDDTCAGVAKLKELDYVVFENASEYERGCNYTFKVRHTRVEEVLAILNTFDPRELSESTHTIKRQLDDFTSEAEILENKLDSIDETLSSALGAYDEITALATRSQDAEALARIFDSKINIIERLTRERINVVAQLERLERGRAEQLDRLVYTYFYVHIYENKFIDGDDLKDSWKVAVRQFVRDVNRTIQDITINLVSLLFLTAQYVLYFFILLFIVKYLWKATKYIWKK